MAARTARSTSGSMPAVKYSSGTPSRTPRTSRSSVATYSGTGASIEVASMGSWPAMAPSSSAASVTSAPNGPG